MPQLLLLDYYLFSKARRYGTEVSSPRLDSSNGSYSLTLTASNVRLLFSRFLDSTYRDAALQPKLDDADDTV